ncbi:MULTISPECIES: O-antigen ligase [unclassified Nodularia (in: cyanobacteria)]|uniref:O-antigen ligase family protein n=1 Tax=unclassified Nodularia (in: cyanobacteria) TaxID=2656917 RepID=UPI0018806E4C|nr:MULTISPECIES: O-antigen ligase [unclassified Nodularia (in: cyanobacteria)]MBE9198540.1 O-antigen ligase family protein [Nodularia sp. LEGE 06071]MCC2693608.1 O-antigen ligase family protein [Nodularia sp. LEGE 04288]
MKKNLLFAEKAFTVLSLLHYSGGPLVVIAAGGMSEGDGSGGSADFAVVQLVFLVIYLVTFCLLVLRWKKVINVITKDGLIWALVILALFSIFWSDVPNLTRTRSIALFGTTLFSLYLASRYTLKEQLQLLAWTFGIAIFASCVFILGLPKYGRMTGVHWGAWRGIYYHKNVLGKVMAPSVFVFLLMALETQKRRNFYLFMSILSIFLIIRSGSSSPLGNVFIMTLVLSLVRVVRWRYDYMIPGLVALVTLSTILQIFLQSNAEAIAALFGKDLTLTGRTNMWPYIFDKIWERPWLGYGFGAFWLGLQGHSAYVWYGAGWKSPNSHNGYFDLLLELGFVGLSIYLVGFFTSLWKGLNYLRFVKTPDGFWPVIYLIYIVLANFTESTLIIQNDFFLVIQFSIFFGLRVPQSPVIDSGLTQEIPGVRDNKKKFKNTLYK